MAFRKFPTQSSPARHASPPTITMKRRLQLFYWISGDPPSDSYELEMKVEDGQPLPTASKFQQTMAATNDRLAGAYLRMWKVGSNKKYTSLLSR